jgi:drug/metabolite transporter (DMT)-like permease
VGKTRGQDRLIKCDRKRYRLIGFARTNRNRPHMTQPTDCRHQASATARPGFVPGHWLALGALLIATALWGSTFVFIQAVETTDSPKYLSPAALTLGRFALASLVYLPFFRRSWKYWRVGLDLGFWMAAGYATQAVALLYTSVPRVAFLSSLYVILLPAAAVLRRRRVPTVIWVGAILALAGTGLLSFDGGAPNRGDAWALATAVAWAFFIERFGHHCRRAPMPAVAAMNVWGVTFFSLLWFVATPGSLAGMRFAAWGHLPWVTLIYLGLGATALAAGLQAVGQRRIPAAQAAILYTLEPVFACVAGYFYRGILLHLRGYVGSGMILLAAMLTQVPGKDSRGEVENERKRD